MIDAPDNVTAGISQLPQALQATDTSKWLSIYLERVDTLQALEIDLLNNLLTWDQLSVDTPGYLLDSIGKLYDQPRPDGATTLEFKRVLLVRREVRKSSGTQPNVRSVVSTLGDFGGGASVTFLIPHTVIVTFANFASVASQGLSLDTTIALLSDTIGDVDRLQIWDAVGNVFAWDLEGQGWGQGVWATPLYDSED